MKVGELISLLSEMPAEAEVMIPQDRYYWVAVTSVKLDDDGDVVCE